MPTLAREAVQKIRGLFLLRLSHTFPPINALIYSPKKKSRGGGGLKRNPHIFQIFCIPRKFKIGYLEMSILYRVVMVVILVLNL